jgi:hypothetical protein
MAPLQIQSHQLKWSTGSAEATTNVSTVPVNLWGGKNSFQVILTGTGSVSVTATLQVSNDASNWIDATALSLSGTGGDVDGATLDAAWKWARITLASITGTAATVTVYHGGGGA